MDDSQAQVIAKSSDGNEKIRAGRWLAKEDITEEDLALLEETVSVEITMISGTIPIWVEK